MQSQRKGRDTYGKLEIKPTQLLPKTANLSVSPTWLQITARPQEGSTTQEFSLCDKISDHHTQQPKKDTACTISAGTGLNPVLNNKKMVSVINTVCFYACFVMAYLFSDDRWEKSRITLSQRKIIVLPIFLICKKKSKTVWQASSHQDETGDETYFPLPQAFRGLKQKCGSHKVLIKLRHCLISGNLQNKLCHTFDYFHPSALRLMVHIGQHSFKSSSPRCENLVPRSLRKSHWIFQWLKMLKPRQE